MKINGKITEIITSRAFVSFGGFVELEGKEFEDMKNIFTYLSKDKSVITSIKIIEFGEKTTKFILLNGDEVTIDNNQKLIRNSEGYVIIKVHNEQSNQ